MRLNKLIVMLSLCSGYTYAQEKEGYLYTFRSVNAAKPHEWIVK